MTPLATTLLQSSAVKPATLRTARAVFLDAASLGDGVDLASLSKASDTLARFRLTSADQLVDRLAGANVAICNKTRLDSGTLAALPTLDLVLVTATGVNNIDLAAAAAHGVEVRNCRDYGTPAVAQHTVMLMLALHTRMLDYQRQLVAGEWQRAEKFCLMDLPILELEGRTLGIFGQGAIGGAVAELARAFGMKVVFAQLPGRSARADTLPWREVLTLADVISLHCPLTETTEHLIDAEALAAMKPGAFLINTARAALVDTSALAEMLRSGHLGGAGLDGLEVEPPRAGHLLLDPSIPNLILTPHNAWASLQARRRIVEQTAENLHAWRRGDPLRVVTIED